MECFLFCQQIGDRCTGDIVAEMETVLSVVVHFCHAYVLATFVCPAYNDFFMVKTAFERMPVF